MNILRKEKLSWEKKIRMIIQEIWADSQANRRNKEFRSNEASLSLKWKKVWPDWKLIQRIISKKRFLGKNNLMK